MNSKELDFLVSAITEHNPFIKTEDFMDWFFSRQQAHRFRIEQIPFKDLDKWSFESYTGNLVHTSRKFFSVEGIWVETNFGPIPQWSQPIINQPEVGILGILTKKFDGILYFLMQIKMEPGNINIVQLAPTVQATRSNYTRVHQGLAPPYLEYFLNRSDSKVLIDALQSEQGARFLRKRNRNIIIETQRDVPVQDDYCWLTLGQIHKLMQQDNIVNMDARSVLASVPFAAPELERFQPPDIPLAIKKSAGIDMSLLKLEFNDFELAVMNSLLGNRSSVHDLDAVISWFTEHKMFYELEIERIPLKLVKHWYRTDFEINHDDGKYFSVIAVSVEADNREVPRWTQPLIKPKQEGIVACLVKNIKGVLHFLVQAKVEPGNFDVVEMAPTVQCITGSYKHANPEDRPPMLEYVLNIPSENVRFTSMQSEEGGRFFREQNRNMLIEAGDDFPLEVPDNYIWITMNQLKRFIKYNNFVNVEDRSILACIGFI